MSDPSSSALRRFASACSELLGSMRFAISLLTIICIASVIGTVLKQHEPTVNYVNQFGPFWGELFLELQLNAVYSAWWFLLILAFLVMSTTLCILRNAPKYLADIRNYKENLREQSLQSFHHKADVQLAGTSELEARRLGDALVQRGWKVKLQQRATEAGPGTGWMVAAKAGAANKLGYIAAHSAIVLICLGGLFDGDMIVRAQMFLGDKTPYTGGGLISEVPAEHRLSDRNPTFRGNLLVAEGTQSSTAMLALSDGILLQELPFAIELKKFIVEYYETGMPKLFASEVVLHDKETGETQAQRIEVNHPARFKGIEIYQSSFDDGGSSVKLKGHSLDQLTPAMEIDGEIGGSTQLHRGSGASESMTLEFTALRTINVENFSETPGQGDATDVRKVDLRTSIDARLGAGNKTVTAKELRNVGPSITYKLRDSSGQAREFHNYMLPVDMKDGAPPVFLLGVRDTPAESFRYLRVPADDQSAIDGFMRLRAALADADQRNKAVQRYVAQVVEPGRNDLMEQLSDSANKALALFAGAQRLPSGQTLGGLPAVSEFIEQNVPEAERSRAGEVLIRILNGVLFEMAQLSRESAGQARLEQSEATQRYMTQAVLSLSDAHLYPVPIVFMLDGFEHVQASVFQVARAPGKNIVYLGCFFLIVGVFAMLYIRERRVWIWVTPQQMAEGEITAASHARMAFSTNRKTLDTDCEFAQLAEQLLGVERPKRVGDGVK